MNRFIIFMFVIATYFGLLVSVLSCKRNTIEIMNELGPGLEIKQIRFGDKLGRRTRWTCLLKHGLYMRYYKEFIAYRAGNIDRCGALRRWVVRNDGIYLVRDRNPQPKFHHAWNKTK
uniref:F21J9.32 n=2 Tax=Arabidopsis thaliana TaxID=3702 RepID=Q9FYJ9_ARATH|nr:F21J9.32 [Arabidopsis thaliana]